MKEITRECKTLDEFKFELLLINSSLQNTEEYLINKQIKEEKNMHHWYENCRFAPCEECTCVDCPRFYEFSKG